MSAIRPGSVRVIAKPVGNDAIPSTNDAKIEVQQADGSWLEIPDVLSVAITLKANALLVADVQVILTELDVEAFTAGVTRTKVVEPDVDPVDEELVNRFGVAALRGGE